MFKLFKKKSEKEKMLEQYENLLKKSFILSKTDRVASDKMYAEAHEILAQIDSDPK